MSPALQSRFLTTGPPGKPLVIHFKCSHVYFSIPNSLTSLNINNALSPDSCMIHGTIWVFTQKVTFAVRLFLATQKEQDIPYHPPPLYLPSVVWFLFSNFLFLKYYQFYFLKNLYFFSPSPSVECKLQAGRDLVFHIYCCLTIGPGTMPLTGVQ